MARVQVPCGVLLSRAGAARDGGTGMLIQQ